MTIKNLCKHALVVALCACAASGMHAQEFPAELNGSMMPYDFSQSDTIVPWGKNFKPVFINYVGRHGARFLSSAKKVALLRGELEKAQQGKYISAKGTSFLRLLQKVDSVTAGRWGALSQLGFEEETRLGGELAQIAPQLLMRGHVEARSSYVPRVVMSMYAACHALARYSSYLEISASEGRQYDSLLRFFTTDSTYAAYLEAGSWRSAMESFRNQNVPTAPAASLFTKQINTAQLRKLTEEMYGVLQSLPAAGLEWHPEEWFSEAEYRRCWEAANLQHYYQRSASQYSLLAAESAAPLLRSIIASTEAAASQRSDELPFVGLLQFGHAETLMPLFALMQLPGCYAPSVGDAAGVAKAWRDYDVVPLGANLVVVLLQDETGRPFVAARLNGRWATLSGNEKVAPWEEVRAVWQGYVDATERPSWRPAPMSF